MAYKYYYVDDDPEKTITETARGLSIKRDLIDVVPFQHKTWKDEIEFLKENQSAFDGLLVDWKLNKKNAQNEEADFNIEALVQQLRTIITKGELKDIPIVLCSAEYEFKKSFEKESTAQDLFDSVYEKDEFEENKDEVIDQLYSLAKAYIELKKSRSISTLLNKRGIIDYRLKDQIENMINLGNPDHDIIRFILKNLIKISGLLIDKYVLSARLGIDIFDTDSEEWNKLISIITSCEYEGVLNSGWKRWWASEVISWWRESFDCELGDLDAEERVVKLNEKFGLRLIVATKMAKCSNNTFWTICKKTNKPISLKDAILSSENYEKVPWQEDQYYSIDAALELPSAYIHPLDRDRVEKLKIRYTKKR